MNGSLRIALGQCNPLVGDIDGNADMLAVLARQARDELKADLIVFPELALSGYPPEDLLLRSGFIDRAEQGLRRLAEACQGIDVVVGHPWRSDAGLINAASLLRAGHCQATYAKQHLPNYGVFDERRYFVSGSEACVIECRGIRLGLTVCEDMWQPGPAAAAAAAGAQAILNLNASPFHANKMTEREAVVADRIAECGLPVIYVNMVGGQDELVFDGASFVMDADKRVGQRLPDCEPALALARLELSHDRITVAPGEQAPVPSLEAAVYQVIVLGVRDYVNKNGFKGVVIGLSGGIDSALTLAIAVDALGVERVEAVMMPSRYTADMSLEDAQQQAATLGVDYRVIAIEPMFNAFLESLKDEFAGRAADVTEENIQARVRGVLLMAISNKSGRMVLTTGNKSEMAVGYATLYGDMAGGFAAIKDVPKTLVYRLAAYRNSLGAIIPQRVIDRPPSAELRPDQKDTDSLPDYEVLDAILEAYVERDLCVSDIVALGFDEALVSRVATMVDRNEYKRRQAAPGVRVTRRAFGRDRRYPLTSGFNRRRIR